MSVYFLLCACVAVLFITFQKVSCAAYVRVDVRGEQVFLCFFVYWLSDINIPCSNVTLDKFNCKTYIVS